MYTKHIIDNPLYPPKEKMIFAGTIPRPELKDEVVNVTIQDWGKNPQWIIPECILCISTHGTHLFKFVKRQDSLSCIYCNTGIRILDEEKKYTRSQITRDELSDTVEHFCLELKRRLEEKGWGTFVSSHEIDGVIDEEVREFKDALHDNNHKELAKELMDIAVGAIFAHACVKAGHLEW